MILFASWVIKIEYIGVEQDSLFIMVGIYMAFIPIECIA